MKRTYDEKCPHCGVKLKDDCIRLELLVIRKTEGNYYLAHQESDQTMDDDSIDDPEDADYCPRCNGLGKIPTMDQESYLGSMYKPCPVCFRDECVGEPRLS